MTMPDHLVDKTIEEARHGGVTMTTRGRSMTIRFGLPPGRVLRNYDDLADTWLCVRKMYRDGGFRWHNTGLSGNTDRRVSRIKSRKRLEPIIRSMSMGSGGAYIEVLAWREDRTYPKPLSLSEVEAKLTD